MKGQTMEIDQVDHKKRKSLLGGINKISALVIICCWFVIFVEGYDLVVYGVVLPTLMGANEWGLSSKQAGVIGSYALLGMFFGSVFGGFLSDKWGRKPVLIISLIFMSIMMMLTAMTTSVFAFGVYRFFAGLGIGGVVPAAAALTTEYSPLKYRSTFFVIMYSGFAVGGVCAATFGVLLLESFGWRTLFWIGALPILIVPFLIKYLPESIGFLQANKKEKRAQEIITRYNLEAENGLLENISDSIQTSENQEVKNNSIISPLYLKNTIIFSLLYIMAFLLIYGMNTWLPQIMRGAGYPLNSSIAFLLIFNFSAIIGGIFAGRLADIFSPKRVIACAYFLAAISIYLLSFKHHIVIMYFFVAVAGFGTTGSTFVLASFVMKQYNSANRASALGTSSAIGRFGAVLGPLLVGILLDLNYNYKFSFYAFALVAVLAACTILIINIKKSSE